MPSARILCPGCHKPALRIQTKYGPLNRCNDCDMKSWGNKPLVYSPVLDARRAFHDAFDRLWQNAETMYQIKEPVTSDNYARVVGKLRRAARGRAYRYVSFKTGIEEKACHGGAQDNLRTLDRITKAAQDCTGPEEIRRWWKETESHEDVSTLSTTI